MQIFGSGPRLDTPSGDPARQAVAALRGHAYQLYASALAWLTLPDGAMLYLEIAEDFAVATQHAVSGTQVRDTAGSGAITLQSAGAREALNSFVAMVNRNPGRTVWLGYLTTSPIGLERRTEYRIDGVAALHYWRRAAAGADLAPLRGLINALDLSKATHSYLRALSDDAYRMEFLQRIHWNCGAPGLVDVRADLEAGLVEYVATARRLSSQVARGLTSEVLERILMTAASRGSRALRRCEVCGIGLTGMRQRPPSHDDGCAAAVAG